MGIFFKSAPLVPTFRESLRTAIITQPPENEPEVEQMVAEVVTEVDQKVTGKFAWERFICAIFILIVMFAGGIYTAQNDKLVEWSKVLIHAFELLLGAVIGLITGEAATRQ